MLRQFIYRKVGDFMIFFLVCIKQVLSKFEPQNGEKISNFWGWAKSQLALKKSVFNIWNVKCLVFDAQILL